MVGGLLWGNLSDVLGRKPCLLSALAVNSFFGFLSAFATSTGTLLALRFLTGVGIGGSIPVVFTYFSEFFKDSDRGPYVVLLSLSWMFGGLFTALTALLILSQDQVAWAVFPHAVSSWRVFLFFCAFPAAFAALGLAFFPESPYYSILSGNPDKSMQVLKRIQKFNSKRGFQPIQFRLPPEAPPRVYSNNSMHSIKSIVESFVNSICEIFSSQNRTASICLTVIWFFLSFGFYGFTIWQPQYLKDKGVSRSGSSGTSLYFSTFIINLAQFPGCILSAWTVGRYGRKPTLLVSLFLSFIAIFTLLIVDEKSEIIVFTAIFSGVSVASWNILNVLSTELTPTDLRSSAFGLFATLGRFGAISGNFLFGVFEGVHPIIPIMLVAVSLFVTFAGTLFLPKLGGK